MKRLTPAQQQAVEARGNVLVVAGAGTGKTKTLVERCLHCLLEEKPPVSLEEMLVVTFTDAAAAEIRQRIRSGMEEKAADEPRDLRWAEQLALFETAHIGTLHSFCLELLRQHFYELELDPQVAVMPEEEARLLAEETLDDVLEAHYAKKTEFAEAVLELIQTRGRGWDRPVRMLVLRLHHYTQTLHDPEGWFAAQLAMFASPALEQWRAWFADGLREWRAQWQLALEARGAENIIATGCAALLRELPDQPDMEQWAAALQGIAGVEQACPRGKKGEWRKPLEGFLEEARFLASLMPGKEAKDPLAEDWGWARGQMAALLELAREFTERFSAAKRDLGMLDFHDLEQHALRLLRDPATGQPTEVARRWRERLRFVFVDEYQDINDAQDAILRALSREGAAANRFLVGDVKQSIYGFRLADPRIFQGYMAAWRGESGRAIPLVDNFRSREHILEFINHVFSFLMRKETGSVPYDDEARLQFGDSNNRAALSKAGEPGPRVELHLRLRGGDGAGPGEVKPAELANLDDAGKEARLLALRLRELKAEGHEVWDEELQAMRPVKWGDMAVLLRSPAGKAEGFAREFSRLGVPLVVARSGFYDSPEVTDLLSLLQLLDNPLQDLPALAVLRSPLVGMSADELAVMRLAQREGHIWIALQRYHETERNDSGWPKAERFLENFAGWRRLARQVSLSRCLEAVLSGTHYADWLLTQPRGEQRHANVRRLQALAQQFDRFQRQGLFRFLRFIEAQQAAEIGPEVAAVSDGDAVSLLSIHQSKGLEFPVVAVADLGKAFNQSDLNADIILDEEYGICPQIKPPHSGRRYPSLPWWLARRRQKRKGLAEELRLLYVAMTRARDTLILSGTVSAKKYDQWLTVEEVEVSALSSAGNYLDWLAAWAADAGTFPQPPAGENMWWRWTIYDDLDGRLLDKTADVLAGEAPEAKSAEIDDASWRKLRERLAWEYPFDAATRWSAKTSVTAARRKWTEENDAQELFKVEGRAPKPAVRTAPGKKKGLPATQVGAAHHTFLQLVSLEKVGTVEELREEAQRLESEKALSAEEVAALDLAALAAFWRSELGKRIRAQAAHVRRELEFTARFTPHELAECAGGMAEAGVTDAGEFVVVQGAADLAVLLPEEIWLVDFKTDQIAASELADRARRYEGQLRLYGRALSGIYGRPVTEAWLHFLAVDKSVAVKPRSEVVNPKP